MDFNQTIEFLYKQLPVFQRIGKSAYKDNLDNTHALDTRFGHPHQRFKTIHVAGTNGKGSTSHMLASVLQEAGYNVGLYTSPHLVDMRERIRVNGTMVEQQYVVDFVQDNLEFILELKPSFFELMVLMALTYFESKKVDVAVMEVGMGGRLDSTNIIHPELSVITNIGLDHTQFLGDTLQKIAAEKAGIIKPGIPVVVGERQPEIEQVFIETARKNSSKIVFASDHPHNYQSDLTGIYQQKNIGTALTALGVLNGSSFEFTEEHLRSGLLNVVRNTGLMGRWQVLGQQPPVVCDTGHNKEGLQYVVQQIASTPHKNLHLVLGMVNEKDAEAILNLFPKNATFYLCQPKIPRAMPLARLVEAANKLHLNHTPYETVEMARRAATANACNEDLVFVGGSTFVVAEVLEHHV